MAESVCALRGVAVRAGMSRGKGAPTDQGRSFRTCRGVVTFGVDGRTAQRGGLLAQLEHDGDLLLLPGPLVAERPLELAAVALDAVALFAHLIDDALHLPARPAGLHHSGLHARPSSVGPVALVPRLARDLLRT